MVALVVYESMFGNTRAIAERIGDGLRPHGEVVVAPCGEVDPELVAAADLLVVGGPTHGHTLSTEASRAEAVKRTQRDDNHRELDASAVGDGLRAWLADLGDGHGRPAIAFDTRVDMAVLLTGRASRGIARRLSRAGWRESAEPMSFLVDRQDRLIDGEADRAESWAAALSSMARSSR